MQSAKRRARKLNNGSFKVSNRDLRRAFARANNSCSYCEKPLAWEEIEWDHVVPISRGGAHSIGNLVPSCNRCNRNKAWKFVMEWRLKRVVSQYSLRVTV